MITIIYSTHKDENYNKKFKEHLENSIGIKDFEILEYVNHNQYSLSEIYNKGIEKSKYEIVVCCHNDIHLEKGWGKKLLSDFNDNPDFDIIGKAGSCYFSKSGVYWEKLNQTMVGQVYHHPIGQKKWLSRYSPKLPFLIPVVTIDGLFISFNKNKIKHKFDESFGKFHFYDHGFCVPNYLDGIKIGVTSSFEITHQSVGMPNEEFYQSKEKFLDKWGHVLPLDLKPKEPFYTVIKDKKLKKTGKVAIIIPTKGKVNLLYDCVKSFYDNCNSEYFDVFIADTGSSKEEKDWIRENILCLGNVKLIEYNYYNFAKINNDVVKNHLEEKHEFILFSNNDIKILNDVIFGMLDTIKTISNVGTVGCRLYFSNNTIQHNGIYGIINKNKIFGVSHLGLNSYYNFDLTNKKVLGNTGGLLMIRKSVFEKCGYFNENYISCFEDVELNIKCIILGYENYNDGRLVAYHYESQTRNEDPENLNKLNIDYRNNLLPFVIKNIDKLKNYIVFE